MDLQEIGEKIKFLLTEDKNHHYRDGMRKSSL